MTIHAQTTSTPSTELSQYSQKAQDMLARIQAWEHWSEIGKVAAKEYQISQAKYEANLPEYQRFLTMIALGHNGLGMFSQIIDQIWHSHILSLWRYAQFCEEFNNSEIIWHKPQLEPKSGMNCTVCVSCSNCSIRCTSSPVRPSKAIPQIAFAPETPEYFHVAYKMSFGQIPPDRWGPASKPVVA